MEKTLEELRAEALAGQWGGGRKLTFTEKCGAFAALYAGISNQVVARAFDLSPQTVSKISGCLEYDPDPYRYEYAPGQNADLEMPAKILHDHNSIHGRNPNRHRHYQDVAREFEALGVDEFNRRYYTERVLNRIIIAKEQLRQDKQNGIKGRLPIKPRIVDGNPDFENMSSKETLAWRRANPAKYRELFPDHFANGNDGFFGEK